jgi:DNA-binding MarR family transcriptional regulator
MDSQPNRTDDGEARAIAAGGLYRNGKHETRRFYTSQVALLHRLVARSTKQAFGQMFGITQMEWRVLVQLEYRSPSKISEINERTLMQKPQISSTLPQLIRKGYAVRANDPNDARAPWFAITEKGLGLYKEVFAVSRTRQRGLESLLTIEERKVFESAFQRIVDFYVDEEHSGGDAMFGAEAGRSARARKKR